MAGLPNSLSIKRLVPSGSELLRLILEPLSAPRFLSLTVGGVLAATIYCQLWCLVAFFPFAGIPMPLEASLAWAIAIVPPWLIAFEICKRSSEIAASPWARRLVVVSSFALAAVLAVVLELGMDGLVGVHSTRSLPIQVAGQIPMALIVAGALILRRSMPRDRSDKPAIYSDDLADLVARANRIEWIKAAGNYVETREDGRTRLYRTTMQALEQTLDPSRFVRIHRQVIVNSAFLDRDIDPGDIIRLKDGTVFKIGGRYGANLRSVAGWPSSSIRH